jgi:DNA-binding NarL/FixJ family response regulator
MGLRFLIVDDHPLMRGAIRNNLETLGEAVRCEPASTMADALRLIGAGTRFDLALLDLNLPDANGTSGLETLRSRFPGLPVLVMSGEHDDRTVDRCIAAGAAGFLPKTATPERLAAAVRTVESGSIYLPPELEAAVDRGRSTRGPVRAGLTGDVRQLGLTDRQSDVLRLILRGLPNKLIGRQLQLAEGTVKVHVSAVLRALGVSNRTQAVLAANRLGLRLPD